MNSRILLTLEGDLAQFGWVRFSDRADTLFSARPLGTGVLFGLHERCRVHALVLLHPDNRIDGSLNEIAVDNSNFLTAGFSR